MKEEIKNFEKVVVNNRSQLENALKPFMSDSSIYKLLIEGMNIVKRQLDFKNAYVSDNDYGGFLPAKPADGNHYVWVDTLIDYRLGGKRDGLVITWTLPEGKFVFDPYTRKLECVDASDK